MMMATETKTSENQSASHLELESFLHRILSIDLASSFAATFIRVFDSVRIWHTLMTGPSQCGQHFTGSNKLKYEGAPISQVTDVGVLNKE